MTRVDELIQQLQNLQVQQKELTARLAKEREKEKKANTAEPSFRVGQKVIVTTASLTLGKPIPAGSRGTVTTITAKRIQIRLADGRLTRRAPTNFQHRGFTVSDIHADKEFECLRLDLAPAKMNITPSDQHVDDIERSIRTVKERIRGTTNGMPYRRIPNLMVKSIVKGAMTALNQFPAKDGVSDHISPRTIVTGYPASLTTMLQPTLQRTHIAPRP